MIDWQSSFTYLNRPVRTAEVSSNDVSVDDADLSRSLLLLVLRMPNDPESIVGLERFLARVVMKEPLAIALFGHGARTAFDVLIRKLSRTRTTRHIMTKIIEGVALDAAIRDFLSATWPSTDRFDEWDDYAILTIAPARKGGHLDG